MRNYASRQEVPICARKKGIAGARGERLSFAQSWKIQPKNQKCKKFYILICWDLLTKESNNSHKIDQYAMLKLNIFFIFEMIISRN